MASANHNYVVVELQGRLGNQLFQFASGYAVARRNDARLLFSPDRVPPEDRLLPKLIGSHYVEPSGAELLRVGSWKLDGPFDRLFRSAAFHAARGSRQVRRATAPSFVVWNDTGRFRPQVFDLDLPVRLVGHLQSEQYFADCAEDVSAAIELPPVAAGQAGRGLPRVGVSFRRGDYNTIGWALPLRYYDDALRLVADRVGPMTLVLFGDDPDFVELAGSRLAGFGEVVNALDSGVDPISQLALMASCDHQVIANSSFAWWGAWLGDQRHEPGRVVVAPAEYAGGDRLPSRWVTVAAGVREF